VTATETVMMAATRANAPVTLKNAALEPEVVATAEYLKACGAVISGAGTPTITIRPSALIPPAKPFTVIPDRIEAASFLTLGALAGKEIIVSGLNLEHIDSVLETLRMMNVPLRIEKNEIMVSSPEKISPIDIRTHEYPGFPTDVQAPMTVLLTQAEGESTVLETIFDGRLNYVTDLVRMGADVRLWNPHKATVKGKTSLKARDIDGPDIRAGLAFVLASVIADGISKIGNTHLIDRGYESIEKKLSDVGVSITRE
jgi:UDP-N-acetylglucosamine 1-carboxyvinyltransferase